MILTKYFYSNVNKELTNVNVFNLKKITLIVITWYPPEKMIKINNYMPIELF